MFAQAGPQDKPCPITSQREAATFRPHPGASTGPPSSATVRPRTIVRTGRAEDGKAFERRGVADRVQRVGRDRAPPVHVDQHDVGIGAHGQHALARIKPERLGRHGAGHADVVRQREPAAAKPAPASAASTSRHPEIRARNPRSTSRRFSAGRCGAWSVDRMSIVPSTSAFHSDPRDARARAPAA